jgi:hypothetical protein
MSNRGSSHAKGVSGYMQARRIALTAALALPLTALAAAPAYAGGGYDEAPKPNIHIKDVDAKIIKKVVIDKDDKGHKKKVVKFEYPDPVVNVKYVCYTKQDKYKKGEEVEYGKVEAVLEQKKAERYGSTKAKCDGKERYAEVVLSYGEGKLKPGHAYVKVKITDPQGKEAYDKDDAKVDLVVKKVVKH